MSPDVWHNIWVVVDNNATTPTYDLYMSTGSDSPQLVNVGGDATWRNIGEPGMGINQTLNAMGFMAAGNSGSILTVDNIYYSDGSVLTNPVPEPSIALLGGLGLLGFLRRRR